LSESDSDDDIKAQNPSDIKFIKGIRRHTKNNEKKIGKEKKRAERRIRKKEIASRNENFMPIDLIYSPQEFA
jgi:protein SDA1